MRGMTKFERAAREQIIEVLAKNGYVTYSNILSRFVLNLTEDPDVIAYMIPGQGVIVLNQNLSMEQVSVCVRHEILHEMLQHMQRSIAAWGKAGSMRNHQLVNIAGDFDISNQGYTEADKHEIRNIRLNGAVVSGLVTEDQHPDWVNLTFEEMLEKIKEEAKKIDQMQPQKGEGDEQGDDDDQEGEGQGSGSSSNSQGKKSKGKGKSSEDGEDNSGEEQGSSSGSGKNGDKDDKNGKGEGVHWEDMDFSEMGDEEGEGGEGSDSESDQSKGGKKKRKSAIQQKEAEERAKEIAKETAENGGVDKSLEGVKGDVAELVDVFNSKETMTNVSDENRAAKMKDREKQRERERENKLASGITDVAGIALRIKEFIAKEVGVSRVRQRTWAKPSRKGDNSPTQLARKGTRHRDDKNGKIPSINFYFDQSGSWNDSDIDRGMTIVNQLLQYEKEGLLKIRIYYFAEGVYDDPAKARAEGGTGATHKIIDHAIKTQADNVVVMTDDDMDGQGYFDTSYKAPGAVWFIFRGSECRKIQQHLRGAKLTKVYKIK